jgi:hypothetical protein
MTTTLKIICAWCGKPMGEKDGQGISGETSSMCPDCYKKEMEGNMLKKIRVAGRKLDEKFSRTVEAEELTIPGFEQIKLFTHQENGFYHVSEETTGLAIVNDNVQLETRQQAVDMATVKLQKHGLAKVLEIMAECPLVDSLPEWKEEPINDNR